ncbi:MAG: rhamnulokinase [Ruminococcaceae bacterium]|nr:rhamnulokinase [Oscillospiraceae bacterium]
MDYCLAIDIGASSGRHILGCMENGEIKTQEIYRFENGFETVDGTFAWNVEALMSSIVEGIKKCNDVGIIPKSIAIDTWGVDYVLLDENKKEILPAVAYRDDRTVGVPEKVDAIISREDLYAKTGIQRANYNTIYQLYCDVQSGKIEKAAYLLMMPAYLSYRLTGVIKNEYTIASTSSLVNAETRDWDAEIIKSLGINPEIFAPICPPGSVVGNLKDEIKDYVGFDAKVVFAPAHDTASAVAACTFSNHGVFISSGTWSLVGAENKYPVLTKEAMEANFANEGGVNNTYRFLKNIMGMWLFQNIRKNLDKKYTYDEMMFMAMDSSYKKTFDPNDERLVAPENMIEAVRDCLGEKDLPIADVLASVYHSLAASYKRVVEEIEKVTGEAVDGINIVGGGCQDKYLNQLTEEYTGKPVRTGPIEATAIGNLKTQLKAL